MSVVDDAVARRVEEAGLNNMHTRRQLVYDGWLLFLSPGRAKRGRSVNAHFGSTLPLAGKIAHCERAYRDASLPLLFRVTPFAQPGALDAALAAAGYVAFDETLVQTLALETPAELVTIPDVTIAASRVDAFVEAIGAFRGSPPPARAAHLERLAESPLDVRPVLARVDGAVAGGGIVAIEDDVAGVFDVFTADAHRGRGIGRAVVTQLLRDAWQRGARLAYLQVTASNAPAIAVYRRFGFATRYRYHYRAQEGDAE